MKDWSKDIRSRILTDLVTGIEYNEPVRNDLVPVKTFYDFVPIDVNVNGSIYILMNQLIAEENFTEKNGYNGTVSFLINIVSHGMVSAPIKEIEQVTELVKDKLRKETFSSTKTNFKLHSIKLTSDQTFNELGTVNNIYRRFLRYEISLEQINYIY